MTASIGDHSCYDLPLSKGSDSGPAFTASVVQGVVQSLGINWNLHVVDWPKNLGIIKRMNRILKTRLGKLCQETGLTWVPALPIVILCTQCTFHKYTGCSPYEILYARPPPITEELLTQ